jgi:hypothetical protein
MPTFENFDWITYIEINPDLFINNINTKEKAWTHWVNHGEKEERPLLKKNNSNIHNGRFGNLFFVNMVIHFIALKINLKCSYKYFNKFKELGVYLHIGENEYNTDLLINENNFLDIIKTTTIEKQNIIINNENWFQTKDFVEYLYDYFHIPYNKNKIINQNLFKKRYKNNNDVFVHIRLGDVKNKITNIEKYYDNVLSKIEFINGYISSDDIENSICKKIIKKYNLIEINKSEVETIMFASTCNNIVLSGGTFSWMIGFFAFFSNAIYYPHIENRWYGDIFNFPNWYSIFFD